MQVRHLVPSACLPARGPLAGLSQAVLVLLGSVAAPTLPSQSAPLPLREMLPQADAESGNFHGVQADVGAVGGRAQRVHQGQRGGLQGAKLQPLEQAAQGQLGREEGEGRVAWMSGT